VSTQGITSQEQEMTRKAASDKAQGTHRGHNEGSITERKNADGVIVSFQAQVSVAGGRRSQSFKTRADARRWLLTARSEAIQGRLNPRRPPTLSEYLTSTWLPSIEDKVKTRTHVAYSLTVHRVPDWLGATRMDELKAAQFQRFYTEMTKAKKAARTVRQTHMVLHKACEDALRLDLITRNPTEGVTLPRVPDNEKLWYGDADLAQLFRATDGDRFHALWVLLGTLGLRLGEALGLKWSDIDWTRKTLSLRRTLQRDRKQGKLLLTELKTKGSRRTLTLTSQALEALKAHRDRQEWDKRRDGWQELGLVFCSIYGGPLDQTRIHEHWTPACAKAGIPRYRIHDLRHSVASSLIAGGMGLLEVAHMLGHRNATMVTTVYGHVAPDDHGRAAALMEALLHQHVGPI
jgi:integrase